MINLNMINLNSSNIINEQLSECYEQYSSEGAKAPSFFCICYSTYEKMHR